MGFIFKLFCIIYQNVSPNGLLKQIMKIWITGSKGQLGTELFLQHNKLSGYPFLFTDIDELDLTIRDEVIQFARSEKPGIIVNCAAYTAVDKAEEEPEKAFQLNRDIPAHLTEAATLINAVLVHISTDYVFDGNGKRPYRETDKPNPISLYAQSKYAGELEARKRNENIIIRTSWLYSPHGSNFLKTMIRLGKEKEEIHVVNDQFGTPTSATDMADAILQIIQKISDTGKNYGGIYHYSNEGECSWYEFAQEIMKQAKLKCKVNPVPTHRYPRPAKRPMYSVMNKSKIKHVFGIEIPEWQDSLKKLVNILKNKK